ncbi:hypothetical protein HYPSUDRAFT_855209 [Hypholoma sublateritium FD-334 SS-4]|uniref:F-box domain-containing protein n=1 Tax=Hypholoma sublateritium (strain FD-334 SS-4) TaxID=945553 RepID=A0A0D2NT63_HYPSF|nr:hypothetical protein HYPSUDRAFT_855209 [Hypholoma sublateritium FD-334 SS-4]
MDVGQTYRDVGTSNHTPILKLNRDLLFEIFYINAARDTPEQYSENSNSMNPMVITRQTSHVCQKWNNIILQSPSLWARCFSIDALAQRSDAWRRLVLQRTEQSLLYVTARKYMPFGFEPGVETFLLQLLQQHWSRIREFDVVLGSYHPRWGFIVPRIIESFARPAENLRTFAVCFGLDGPTLHQNLFEPTFRLFSNHAPSLIHLSIKSQIVPVHLTENFMLSMNMRRLHLIHHAVELTDIDLLSAFMRMPQLEDVEIAIHKINMGRPSGTNSLRPSLPRLKSFYLMSLGFDVYPAFLEMIDPGWGCKFYFRHYIHTSTPAFEGEPWPEIRHLQRVTERYTHCLFAHHRSHSLNVVDAELELFGDFNLVYTFFQTFLTIDVQICDNVARDDMMERLFDAFVALDPPHPNNQLTLRISQYFSEKFPGRFEPSTLSHKSHWTFR